MEYNVSFAALGSIEQVAGPALIIGRGRPDMSENLGVDVLVACPEKYPTGVISQHAVLRFAPNSGAFMIGGLSDDDPVHVTTVDNSRFRELDLGKHQWRVLASGDRFKIGELECTVRFKLPIDGNYKAHCFMRDKAFEDAGLPAPDHRLPLFPPRGARRIQDYIIYKIIGHGEFGIVSIAIDARSGEIRAVKEVTMKDQYSRNAIRGEADFSASLSVSSKILTSYIRILSHQAGS